MIQKLINRLKLKIEIRKAKRSPERQFKLVYFCIKDGGTWRADYRSACYYAELISRNFNCKVKVLHIPTGTVCATYKPN